MLRVQQSVRYFLFNQRLRVTNAENKILYDGKRIIGRNLRCDVHTRCVVLGSKKPQAVSFHQFHSKKNLGTSCALEST